MKSFKKILTLLFINTLIGQFLLAEEEQFPLEIDADTSTCATDLEDCVLEGNVVIRQGDASITADKMPESHLRNVNSTT